jgi:hypothetical protein
MNLEIGLKKLEKVDPLTSILITHLKKNSQINAGNGKQAEKNERY